MSLDPSMNPYLRLMADLIKGHVKSYTRSTKSGGTAVVHDFERADKEKTVAAMAERLRVNAKAGGQTIGKERKKTGFKHDRPVDTKALHTDKGRYTPEREALHKKALDHALGHIETAKGRPVAILTGGGSASGKSSVLNFVREHLKNEGKQDYAHIDADEFKKHVPEYNERIAKEDRTAASFAHEESSDLTKAAIVKARGERKNFIYDSTLSNPEKIEKLIHDLHQDGYDVHLVYADLDKEEAIKRAEQRAKEEGREVPLEDIHRTHAGAIKTLGKVHHLADHVTVYSTNVERGQKPKVVYNRIGKVKSKDMPHIADMHRRGHLIKALSDLDGSSVRDVAHLILAALDRARVNHDLDNIDGPYDEGQHGEDYPNPWMLTGEERPDDETADLMKALIDVKAHVRKDGTQVKAHQRNILTTAEKGEIVNHLAQAMADKDGGGRARIEHHGHALTAAHAIAKQTGKAVHVTRHKDGGYALSHQAPKKAGVGSIAVHKDGKHIMHHPEHGKVELSREHAGRVLKNKGGRPIQVNNQAGAAAPAAPAKPEKAGPALAAAPVKAASRVTHSSVPNGPSYASIPANEINVDADAYQFKGGGDDKGVTDRLKSVTKWDATSGLMNPILVHERADGTHYVVDGHQRTGLARRLMEQGHDIPPLNAVVFKESEGYTADMMKRIGALANIRQGTGTAVDIAKVMRNPGPDGHKGFSEEERATIPAGSNDDFKDGEAIASLSDEAFHYLTTAGIHKDAKKNAQFAAIVARKISDPKEQVAALRELKNDPPAGREECEDMVDHLAAEGFASQHVQRDLWGNEVVTESLAKPTAEIKATVRRLLDSEKSALGNAVRHKARLEAAGNTINEEANKKGYEAADTLAKVLKEFSSRTTGNEVRDAIKEAAKQYAAGTISRKRAADHVVEALENFYAGIQGSGGGLSVPRGASAGPETLFEHSEEQQKPAVSSDQIALPGAGGGGDAEPQGGDNAPAAPAAPAATGPKAVAAVSSLIDKAKEPIQKLALAMEAYGEDSSFARSQVESMAQDAGYSAMLRRYKRGDHEGKQGEDAEDALLGGTSAGEGASTTALALAAHLLANGPIDFKQTPVSTVLEAMQIKPDTVAMQRSAASGALEDIKKKPGGGAGPRQPRGEAAALVKALGYTTTSPFFDLVKALITVKAHTKKDGTRVKEHQRNVITAAERGEIVKQLAHKLYEGKHAKLKNAGAAIRAARAVSDHTGKDVHAYKDANGHYRITHDHATATAHPASVTAHHDGKMTHTKGGETRELRRSDYQAIHTIDPKHLTPDEIVRQRAVVRERIHAGKSAPAHVLDAHKDLKRLHAKRTEARAKADAYLKESRERERAMRASKKEAAAAAKLKDSQKAHVRKLAEQFLASERKGSPHMEHDELIARATRSLLNATAAADHPGIHEAVAHAIEHLKTVKPAAAPRVKPGEFAAAEPTAADKKRSMLDRAKGVTDLLAEADEHGVRMSRVERRAVEQGNVVAISTVKKRIEKVKAKAGANTGGQAKNTSSEAKHTSSEAKHTSSGAKHTSSKEKPGGNTGEAPVEFMASEPAPSEAPAKAPEKPENVVDHTAGFKNLPMTMEAAHLYLRRRHADLSPAMRDRAVSAANKPGPDGLAIWTRADLDREAADLKQERADEQRDMAMRQVKAASAADTKPGDTLIHPQSHTRYKVMKVNAGSVRVLPEGSTQTSTYPWGKLIPLTPEVAKLVGKEPLPNDPAGHAASPRDTFSMERIRGDETMTHTFNRGQRVKVWFSSDKVEQGEIIGISHANKTARILFDGAKGGVEFPFGAIYPLDHAMNAEAKQKAKAEAAKAGGNPALEPTGKTYDLKTPGGGSISIPVVAPKPVTQEAKPEPVTQEEPKPEPKAEAPAAAGRGVVSRNEALNGVEVKFHEKPDREHIDRLKAAGFRWHKQQGLWYARHTAEREALAHEVAGTQGATMPGGHVAAAEEHSGKKPGAQPGNDNAYKGGPKDEPAGSHVGASTPSGPHPRRAAGAEVAAKLREKADALESTIQGKINPGVLNQNPTRRRAEIGSSMIKDGERLQKFQQALRALAEHHEAGTVPESLAGIRSTADVESLIGYNGRRNAFVRKNELEDLLEATKGLKGAGEDRARVESLMRGIRAGEYSSNVTSNDIAALERLQKNALKAAERKGVKPGWSLKYMSDNWKHEKRLNAAGITRDKHDEAVAAMHELMGPKTVDPEQAKKKKLRELESQLIGRKIDGFFPTPRALVDQMVDKADLQPGHSILEPSAGHGAIADVLAELGHKVDTIEVNHTLREILQEKGHNLVGDDFLAHQGEHDRIIMNPPFENGQDIDHVRHAYDRLKPGGKLVSIMGEGSFSRSDKKASDFRDWLAEKGGSHEKNPDGSFTGAGALRQTGVATRTVVIEKPPAHPGHGGELHDAPTEPVASTEPPPALPTTSAVEAALPEPKAADDTHPLKADADAKRAAFQSIIEQRDAAKAAGDTAKYQELKAQVYPALDVADKAKTKWQRHQFNEIAVKGPQEGHGDPIKDRAAFNKYVEGKAPQARILSGHLAPGFHLDEHQIGEATHYSLRHSDGTIHAKGTTKEIVEHLKGQGQMTPTPVTQERAPEPVTQEAGGRRKLTADTPAHHMGASAFLATRGIHEPHIAEISPMQYANMGKQQKAAYDRKRTAEWEASAAGKSRWRNEVLQAYHEDKTIAEHPDTHEDAKQAIKDYHAEQKRNAEKASLQAAHNENNIKDVSELRVGDKVWSIMSREYCTITKLNKNTVQLTRPGGMSMKQSVGALQWKSHSDVEAAHKAGEPIKPAGAKVNAPAGATASADAYRAALDHHALMRSHLEAAQEAYDALDDGHPGIEAAEARVNGFEQQVKLAKQKIDDLAPQIDRKHVKAVQAVFPEAYVDDMTENTEDGKPMFWVYDEDDGGDGVIGQGPTKAHAWAHAAERLAAGKRNAIWNDD